MTRVVWDLVIVFFPSLCRSLAGRMERAPEAAAARSERGSAKMTNEHYSRTYCIQIRRNIQNVLNDTQQNPAV